MHRQTVERFLSPAAQIAPHVPFAQMKRRSIVKLAASLVVLVGVAGSIGMGESEFGNFMIAGGALTYLAVLIEEWWEKK